MNRRQILSVISAPPIGDTLQKSASTTGPEIRMKMMSSKWIDLGISMAAIKHGLCFESTFHNNINSHVSINDGFHIFKLAYWIVECP